MIRLIAYRMATIGLAPQGATVHHILSIFQAAGSAQLMTTILTGTKDDPSAASSNKMEFHIYTKLYKILQTRRYFPIVKM